MPTTPGGIAPPSSPPKHNRSAVRIAGSPRGDFTAICDFPDCFWAGDARATYDEAAKDRDDHVGNPRT